MSGIARHHSEWLSLIEVSGPFLTLPVLARVFPQGLPKVDGRKLGRLRAAYEEWANAQDAKAPDASALHATWVKLVLSELLEFDDQTLRSGDGLPSGLDALLAEHHETLRPSMAIVEPSDRAKAGTPRLLIAVWPSDQDLESAVPAARWAASPLERMTELCRSTRIRLGLVTNGKRWTVVDKPEGQTAGYASWYAGLWLQEPITLAAFDAVLGVRRFFAVAETDTIEALLDESVAFQQEVTDQLGYQVRRAVEVLVQALDRADLDRERELLRDVPPPRLYDAALTVMMRLVFLFCAEERGLLLLGDETYDINYAVSTLRALLREEADRVGVEVLERRQDAWARLLATFRAVHGGVEHDALRLPALGGSLFDPDRFPFLEGRAAGTSWFATPASPLPIDNRTVLHLLEALQLLRTRGDGGTSEARKLSYRALDIEQIGHVYEGLLDHLAVRVEVETLGLTGTRNKEPELSLEELNRERRLGRDGLIEYLKEHTGRSTSALRNDLDAELDEVAEQRLLVACGNDKALVKRIAPYHALIREDVWGYPQIYRAGSFMVTGGSERRQTGTHYTPKSLTEQIVTETLEPLVYVGPPDGTPREAWRLRSAAELLGLKICDMAMGSGAFLVQVCRWLAERVVEAWEEAERQGAAISADGEVLEKAAGRDLLPPDRDERLSFARRVVAERCIYGVDINPMAVELAKLSLWLVTLSKGRPFGFLDHNLRSGDSLLGITSLEQLENFHLDPVRGKSLHHTLFDPRKEITASVSKAVEARKCLRAIRILDIEDVRAMERLDDEAHGLLDQASLVADLILSAAFAACHQRPSALDEKLARFADVLTHGTGTSRVANRDLRTQAEDLIDTGRPAASLTRRPFHWITEFPEAFAGCEPGFDAVVGNPPFLGGVRISEVLGEQYNRFLVSQFSGSSRKTDLSAFFFRRAYTLLRPGGLFGLLATNTISQGTTRKAGLEVLLRNDASIVGARTSFVWPGVAAVIASYVCVYKGKWQGNAKLNGSQCEAINGLLEVATKGEKRPKRLLENRSLCFQGSSILGSGFFLTPEEAKDLIAASPRNHEVVKPCMGGEELNTRIDETIPRWIIDFFEMEERDARTFREPFEIVRDRVRGDRLKKDAKKYPRLVKTWWKHWHSRTQLYEGIRTRHLSRVLARSRVSDHHMVDWLPPNILYTEALVVFLLDRWEDFGVLQSSIHDLWSRRFASTLKTDVRYIPTDCFGTFPLPQSTAPLHEASKRYWLHRSEIKRSWGVGLTKIYNAFNDPTSASTEIRELRRLRTVLDRHVVEAYGWGATSLSHGFLKTGRGLRYTISPSAAAEVISLITKVNLEREGVDDERQDTNAEV